MRVAHNPLVVQRLARAALAVLALLLALDLLTTHSPHFARHGLTFDTWPLFYPVLGFASTFALVMFAKSIGLLLSRPEGYYAAD